MNRPAGNDDWPWYWMLAVWSLIAFGVLYFGGLAAEAFKVLLGGVSEPPCTLGQAIVLGCAFSQALLIFAVGGGLAFGLFVLAWWRVTLRGFSWTLGLVILGAVLVAIFVWPTPYKYEWAQDKNFVVRIHRFSGDIHYQQRSEPTR